MKRYYLRFKEIKWIHDTTEEETRESIRLKSIIAIARYVIEHPERIQFLTKEEFEK